MTPTPPPDRYAILGAMLLGIFIGLPTGVCIGIVAAKLLL